MSSIEIVEAGHSQRHLVYQNLERNIDLLVDFWRVIKKMPPVSWSGRKYLDDKDKLRFTDLLVKAAVSFPQQTRRYDLYEQIRNDVDTVNKFLKIQEAVGVDNSIIPIGTTLEMRGLSRKTFQYLQSFHEDPDFVFLTYLDRGITGALYKRKRIRDLFRKLGKRSTQGDVYDQFLTKDAGVMRGHIREVIPSRFSVNLVVDDGPFYEFQKAQGRNNPTTVQACHLNKSIFNLLRVNLSGTDRAMFMEHEDFHSLVETVFSPLTGEPFFANVWDQSEQESRLKSIQDYVDKLEGNKRQTKKGSSRLFLSDLLSELTDLEDAGYEELIAELVSEPYTDVPKRTFARFIREKQSVLTSVLPCSPEVYRLIRKYWNLVHFSKLNSRIWSMYAQIETHAPDKVDHLGVAFVLFPPSQFRHIERLVRRWCSEKESEE